jgi:hypothetical protein
MIKDDFKYFKFLKSEGYSSESAYTEAKKLRLDYFACIRMLRSIYGLSLTEAKKVTFQAEQYAYKDASQLQLIKSSPQSEMIKLVKIVDKLFDLEKEIDTSTAVDNKASVS